MASIYVGNLPYSVTEDELRELFEPYGDVQGVKMIMDRETGRPRGFAFVEMSRDDARNAVKEVNGMELGGRSLRVNEAHERPPTRPTSSNY